MQLHLLSGGAAHGLVMALEDRFKTATGLDIAGTFSAVGALKEKLISGAPADLVILTRQMISDLEQEGFVEPGSTVHTDGWEGYSDLKALGFRHKVTVLSRSKKEAHELMPRVHRVTSLLKRWILGTHQGAISHAHLGYYLDEFTFRFNRRKSTYRGKLFYRLLQQAMQTGPVVCSELKKGVREGPERRPRRRKRT